jgi:FixJ family two-component response regulator
VGDAERTVTSKTNSRLGMSFLPKSLVLVVDSDRAVLRGMQRLLQQFGYDTLLFPTADAFKNHSDFADTVCVILDLDLKDGSGIELGRRLKATGISVPVIYTTVRDDSAVRMAALQSGCLAFLTKPFSAQSLIEPLKIASAEPI